MEVERRESDEIASGTNGESKCFPPYPVGSEPDLMSESSLKRRRRSTPKIALSDRTLELLKKKISFPNVSKCRRQYIKASALAPISRVLGDTFQRPYTRPLTKEFKMGSYFDTESPIYCESFVDVPKVEVGKHLDVLDLLGGKLLRFSSGSQIVPRNMDSYTGMCVSQSGVSIRGKGHSNALRVQSPVLRRCVNSVRGRVMASTTSTAAGKVNINVESTLNIKGKYVMIYCVFVPSMWSSEDGPRVYHTALASHELARRDDFVLVVVPMMREGFAHSKSAYQHFLSGFSCLAVPFDDSRQREYICSALGFDGEIKALILDPSQKVLYHGLPEAFDEFGGAEHDCFPFTPEREDICFDLDYVLEDRSLNELLCLSDSDVLYNIDCLAGDRLKEDGRIAVSELKQKFVGLYVYSDGRSLRKLQKVHEKCRLKKYELEIVVVCCPFQDKGPPELHEEVVIGTLASLKLLGWWFVPFNNTVCHRLQRMRENYSYEEGLFIVDPIEKYADPYGFSIIHDFGMNSYPFTRRSLIEKELQRKMGLRLNSLLHREHFRAMCRPHDNFFIPMAVLKNKIVVVYLYYEKEKRFANALNAWYKKNIKGKHSNVEVVAVSLDGSSRTTDQYFLEMGWVTYFTDPSIAAEIRDKYFHPLCSAHEAVVAFGKDGTIQSVDASHILESQHPPFYGDLPDEIATEFCQGGFDYMTR